MLRAVDDLKSFTLYFTTLLTNFYEFKTNLSTTLLTVDNLINFSVSVLFA
jgi:hypothetical protein